MNQTACSLKLHCQQSKNVASSVEGADFVASSSLWTNLMHRRWLRFACHLHVLCVLPGVRHAHFVTLGFGQGFPQVNHNHLMRSAMWRQKACFIAWYMFFWRVDEALIDAMLGFCAQCRALQSRARSGRFHRGVRCWLHEQALTVPFDRGSVARDVVHDDTSIGRKIQTRKQVLD